MGCILVTGVPGMLYQGSGAIYRCVASATSGSRTALVVTRDPRVRVTTTMFEAPVTVDGRGHLLGRLASVVAKELLGGQKVVVVRCEQITISGSREYPLASLFFSLRSMPHDSISSRHARHCHCPVPRTTVCSTSLLFSCLAFMVDAQDKSACEFDCGVLH